jgi:hypothetical protein
MFEHPTSSDTEATIAAKSNYFSDGVFGPLDANNGVAVTVVERFLARMHQYNNGERMLFLFPWYGVSFLL